MIRWNLKNINDLKSKLDRLSEEQRDNLDMSDLPTVHVPEALTSYPIWAMDLEGRCLVGPAADTIEHIDEILQNRLDYKGDFLLPPQILKLRKVGNSFALGYLSPEGAEHLSQFGSQFKVAIFRL